jgi:hypothetical protein
MAKTGRKSKRWSIKDIKQIKKFVLTAKNEGMKEDAGIKAAAIHFGVTTNAVRIRWGRYNKGEGLSDLNKETTKIPMNRKKRKHVIVDNEVKVVSKPNKPRTDWDASFLKAGVMPKSLESNRILTFDIKDISIDLVNKKLTIIY